MSEWFTEGCMSDWFTEGCMSDWFTEGCMSDWFTEGCMSDWFTQGCMNALSQWGVFKKVLCFHCLSGRHQHLMRKVNESREVSSCLVSHNFLLFFMDPEVTLSMFTRSGYCSVS